MALPESIVSGVLEEIEIEAAGRNFARMFELIGWISRQLPLTLVAHTGLVRALRWVVPDVPKFRVSSVPVECGRILEDSIAFARRVDEPGLQSAAEQLAYRWYEAHGEYARARECLVNIQRGLGEDADPARMGRLTNNHGYEYLLEANFSSAEPFFLEALHSFEQLGIADEVANARANWLMCRFRTLPQTEWESLRADLLHSHRTLLEYGDWRVRKTMRLFADRAAARGRLTVAVAWARRAVNASRSISTQHHQEDEDYLHWLERRWRRSRRHPQIPLQLGMEEFPDE